MGKDENNQDMGKGYKIWLNNKANLYLQKSNKLLFPKYRDNFELGIFKEKATVIIHSVEFQLDKNGQLTTFDSEYSSRKFQEGVAGVRVDGKYGFIKKDGSWLVEPKFDNAWKFSEGFASVEVGDKWGDIDKQGNITWDK